MMMTQQKKPSLETCPVCVSSRLEIFIEIPQVPVHCNVLWPTRDEALRAPRGDIRLAFCRACGHIFNIAFDSGHMEYTQDYENSLHFSPRFQKYAMSLAEGLINDYDLYNKDVIEIGCGKGDFLFMLSDLGGNRGIGFDPSYEHERTDNVSKNQITFIQNFYSERYANHNADIICCRHVLEHIQFPRDFLASIRRTISDRLDTVVFFEVPNVMFTLKDLGIWDLIYEHYSYFSTNSLKHIFISSGFKPINLKETFEGQFLCIDALSVENQEQSKNHYPDHFEKMTDYVAAFSDRYYSKVEQWKLELKSMENKGHRAVVWGGGSKGVTFLNTLKVQDQIEYVIDISSPKQGMYVAGTGQKIMPPEFLREYCPDTIVVMNPIYLEEIQQITKRITVTAELVTA